MGRGSSSRDIDPKEFPELFDANGEYIPATVRHAKHDAKVVHDKWRDAAVLQKIKEDEELRNTIFFQRGQGRTYPEILKFLRERSHSDPEYKCSTISSVYFSDWLAQYYPEEWLNAEKGWGFSLFETAKGGALSKLKDRTVTETITNYDAEGEVLGVQVRERFVPADSAFIKKVLETYDPQLWARKEHIATEKSQRDLEIQDAAMSRGNLTEGQADDMKLLIDRLTISADSVDPKKNSALIKKIGRPMKTAESVVEEL